MVHILVGDLIGTESVILSNLPDKDGIDP